MSEHAIESPALAIKAHRDGCGCPPQVERCVHFGTDVLVLTTSRALPKEAARRHQERTDGRPYAPFVVAIVEQYINCACSCGLMGARLRNHQQILKEADALVAFEREEMRLLGRDA